MAGPRPEHVHTHIGVNPAVSDTSNDPEGATIERGMALLEAIVERVATRAGALLTRTTSGSDR